MRRVMLGVLAVGAVSGLALPGMGQSSLVSGNSAPRAVHPYTATFRVLSTQRVEDDVTISHESTEIEAVDSEGRRLSATLVPATGQVPEHSTYRVFDPVARTNTSWSVPGKSATVRPMPPAPGQAGSTCWTTEASQSGKPESLDQRFAGIGAIAGGISEGQTSAAEVQPRMPANETTREQLGTQTILGVEATGTRTTHTTPAGAVGNDAPLVRTSEVWRANSLGLVVRQITEDPRTGLRSRELVDLNQSEPDPAAFQPPEGYEIQTVELHWVPCQH